MEKRVALAGVFFFVVGFAYAQVQPLDLSIAENDVRMTLNPDGSCELFIRKKKDIASVLLMEFPAEKPAGGAADAEETFAYRAREWNAVNGNEQKIDHGARIFKGGGRYQLVDSTPEADKATGADGNAEPGGATGGAAGFGECFHIYIPPAMEYGYSNTRYGTALVQTGLPVNIRAFARFYGDERGPFADNRFFLKITPPDTAALVPASLFARSAENPEPETGPEQSPPTAASADEDLPIELSLRNRSAFSLDIRAGGGVSAFYPGPKGKMSGDLALVNQYVVIGGLSLRLPVAENVDLAAGYVRDALALNQIFLRAAFGAGIVGIEGGVNLGVFNSDATPISPAFSLLVNAASPSGVFSGAFHADFALNRTLNTSGEYFQDFFGINLAVKLPAVLIGAEVSSSSLNEKNRYMAEVISRWSRYLLSAELYEALLPWTARISVGYQDPLWIYRAAKTYSYQYRSVFVGLEATVRIIPALKLFLNAEAPVYPWTYPQIKSLENPQAALLWKAELGVIWHLGPPSR